MAFKMITLSEKEVGRIAGNAGAHAERMAKALTLKWQHQLAEDQKVIDIQQVQLCVRHDLHGLRAEIGKIERQHLDQLETEGLSRDVRDVTIPLLRGQLVGIQSLFDGNFGAGSSTRVFGPLATTIPLDPFPLRRVANGAHDRLTDAGFVLPSAQLVGVQIVPQELAKGFEPSLRELDRVLVELEDTLPISNASLEAKIKGLAELRLQAGIAARFLEALYYLAGHDEIARRVRLSSHRSRRLDAPPANDEPGLEVTQTGDGEQPSTDEEAVASAAGAAEPANQEIQAETA